MCRLQVAPILGRSAGRSIPELPPLRHRFDLINDKGQRMRGIRRFLVMDRPQPAMADATGSAHSPQPGAVLAAQGPVGIPGIAARSFLHSHPPVVIFNSRPASTQTEEKAKDVCELLRAGGADGTGGRTCTFISRFWRPLLCVKLRLQKSAGLSRLSAVIKNRRIRYGRNRHRGLPKPRQHKSRKAVSRSLRLFTLLLYNVF